MDCMIGNPLLPGDLEKLAGCGIDSDLAERAMLRRVDSLTGGQTVGRNGGGDYSGVLFPYIWPGEQCVREYRLRRDKPDLEQDGNRLREKNKYLSPPGRGSMLYFSPGTPPEWLADATIPVLITEGEKKCLALSTLNTGNLIIGLPGVWNWRGIVGKTEGPDGERLDIKGPIPDLDRIEWTNREVTILFDTNVHTNESVRAARNQLTSELRKRGAVVRYVDIPVDAGVNGIDDLIGVWGKERVRELVDSAYKPGGNESRFRSQKQAKPKPASIAEAALHGIAGDFVRTVAPHTESATEAVLIQFLTAAGVYLGRTGYFAVEGDKHYPNLFACVVGDTSKGRKGTSWSQVKRLLQLTDGAFVGGNVASGLSSGEGLIWAIRDEIREQ